MKNETKTIIPFNKRVAVIGAGPAGLTAAYELAKAGIACDVFEASEHVGGMARTFELWNQKVDLGPHRFFSSDPRVNKVWFEVVGDDYAMVDRLTRIYYRKKFFHYPLRPLNALFNLGVFEAAFCLLSYVKQLLIPEHFDRPSFESWVVGRFGRKLFEIFFKSYSEKLWGISCTELDADFAAQRIKKFSLFEAIKSALMASQAAKHKTLVDRFAYPHGGTGLVYERMAAYVNGHGGSVHLKTPVKHVIQEQGRVTGLELTNGEVRNYAHVISTMPLTQMVKGLAHTPREILQAIDQLAFRNTVLVYLEVEGMHHFPDNWLYVHASDLKTGRITNFRNWVPHLNAQSQTTILALEYWCYDQDSLWKADEAKLIELAKSEIQKTGLLATKTQILNGKVVRVPKCYPVYKNGYRAFVDQVAGYLKTIPNLTAIGRYGSFKYNNQDHSILMGILAAENIVANAQHDLWSVNTDYESYQEAGKASAMKRAA